MVKLGVCSKQKKPELLFRFFYNVGFGCCYMFMPPSTWITCPDT